MRHFLPVCFCFFILTACAPMIDSHGNAPDMHLLSKLKTGQTPYTEVQTILGSPSSKTIFGNEYWLYISSTQERFAFFKPEETDRSVTALRFDKNGILQEIDVRDLTDGKKIFYDSAATPMPSHSVSVMDQLINNIGRFEQDSR